MNHRLLRPRARRLLELRMQLLVFPLHPVFEVLIRLAAGSGGMLEHHNQEGIT